MKKIALLSVLVLQIALLSLPARADSEEPEDQVSFQVAVERDVENDRAVATLAVTAENRDPAKLADSINSTMAWATETLKGGQGIQSRSGSYQTHPVYDDKKIVRWRGSQTLQLESADVDALSQSIGALQARLQVQSLQFSVSAKRRRDVEAQLTEEVLAAFQARARLVSKSLGAQDYRLMDVSVHSGGLQRPVPMRVQSAKMESFKSVASPSIEQGTSRISVQASGRIRLLRD